MDSSDRAQGRTVSAKRAKSVSHIQKDHRYYFAKDNYLNSALFASSKVRQFYHEQRDKMQPVRDQLAAAELKSMLQLRSDQAERAQHLRQNSQQRLLRRKLQRSLVYITQLESVSKQKIIPEDLKGISPSTLLADVLAHHHTMAKDKNMWNVWEDIPAQRLKKLLPKKEMEADRGEP